MKKLILLLVLSLCLVGCTSQERAKVWGGTTKIEIPSDRKFLNITWKSSQDSHSLWVLTRPRGKSSCALGGADNARETYYFEESSAYGILEGKVIIVEK